MVIDGLPNPKLELSRARTAGARAVTGARVTDKEELCLCSSWRAARNSIPIRWASAVSLLRGP
jgi:hypothetical protein